MDRHRRPPALQGRKSIRRSPRPGNPFRGINKSWEIQEGNQFVEAKGERFVVNKLSRGQRKVYSQLVFFSA